MVIFMFKNRILAANKLLKQGKNYYIWSTKSLQIVFIFRSILMDRWMSNYIGNMCHKMHLIFSVSEFLGAAMSQMSQMSHFVTLEWKFTALYSL